MEGEDVRPSPFTTVASVLKDAADECQVDVGQLDAAGAERVTCEQPVPELDLFVMDNVLSERECRYLVEATERTGYSFWDSRPEKRTDFRNADTIEVHHPELAGIIWNRIAKFCKKVVITSEEMDGARWERDLEGEWEPIGTNKHVLFARYNQIGHFAPHTDGYSIVSCDERSMYSMVLFLNSCESGGGTRFYADEQRDCLVKDELGRYTGRSELVLHTVQPRVGRLAVFFHQILDDPYVLVRASSVAISLVNNDNAVYRLRTLQNIFIDVKNNAFRRMIVCTKAH